MPTFDTLTIARTLTDAGIQSDQANAITDAVRQATEHGEHVTPDMLRTEIAGVHTEIATVRTEIASLRADLTWRMLGVAGLVVAALRLLA